jgi:hypothetical protein
VNRRIVQYGLAGCIIALAAAAIYAIVRLYILWQRVGSSLIPINVVGFAANPGVLIHLTKKEMDLEEEELSGINERRVYLAQMVFRAKLKMRAETLILQDSNSLSYLLFHQTPSPDDDMENFYWSSSSKIKWMLLCPVASSDRSITFFPKHSFHASTVRAACSQIFLVNPHIHNRDILL